MDNLSHALLGAAVTQAVFTGKIPGRVWLIGCVAGLFADIDAFFLFSTDNLRNLLWHRHFTHSLLMIPIGGLLTALPFIFVEPYKRHRIPVVTATLMGFTSHSFLDIFTSYGTLIFWPFSYRRIALDYIAIVDPVFTLILLIGVIWAAVKTVRTPALLALFIAGLYMVFGWWQHERANSIQLQLAHRRGHEITRGRLFPSFGNLVLWRSLYQSGNFLYADGVVVPFWKPAYPLEGASTPIIISENVPEAQQNPGFKLALERLSWFADGYLARVPTQPEIIGDMRYSIRVAEFSPLWGIRPASDTGFIYEHLKWKSVHFFDEINKHLRDALF